MKVNDVAALRDRASSGILFKSTTNRSVRDLEGKFADWAPLAKAFAWSNPRGVALQASEIIEANLKRFAPRRTGALAGGLNAVVRGDPKRELIEGGDTSTAVRVGTNTITAYFFASVPYALEVDEGAERVILSGTGMSFMGTNSHAGTWVSRIEQVQHTVIGQRYIDRAMRASQGQINTYLSRRTGTWGTKVWFTGAKAGGNPI